MGNTVSTDYLNNKEEINTYVNSLNKNIATSQKQITIHINNGKTILKLDIDCPIYNIEKIKILGDIAKKGLIKIIISHGIKAKYVKWGGDIG